MEQDSRNQVARDPEDRRIDENNAEEKKDKMMDKTIADTFPASDPPSSIPDPDDDSFRNDNDKTKTKTKTTTETETETTTKQQKQKQQR
jgi:hypothetical protein